VGPTIRAAALQADQKGVLTRLEAIITLAPKSSAKKLAVSLVLWAKRPERQMCL
jgi:hypothetical protein